MTSHNAHPPAAIRLAAPAPVSPADEEIAPALDDAQRDLDDLCERYVAWRNSRRLFGPPPSSGSVLGQLAGSSGGSRPSTPGGPDALNSTELAAFHLAYCSQPQDKARGTFDAYYILRVRPIKLAADALGISRPTFYRMLANFRQHVAQAAKIVEAENIAAGNALPHRGSNYP